jgi:hypothetical protein
LNKEILKISFADSKGLSFAQATRFAAAVGKKEKPPGERIIA